MKISADLLAGAFGGSCGLVIGYSFDTTKIHLQTLRSSCTHHVSIWNAAKVIYLKGGVKNGFFRGLSGPFVTYSLTGSIFFGVYGVSLKYLQPDRDRRDTDYSKIYLAGCIGGAAQLIPLIPVDQVKVLMQSQVTCTDKNAKIYKSPIDCARTIIKTKGLKGLYKGGGAMFFRDIPCFGMYCLTYQAISGSLKSLDVLDARGVVADLIGGGCAGCFAWLSVMPLDVIKNRYQADTQKLYKSPWDCAVKSLRREGLAVFFRGGLVTCLRAFPVNAIEFMVYAQTLRYFENSVFHMDSLGSCHRDTGVTSPAFHDILALSLCDG